MLNTMAAQTFTHADDVQDILNQYERTKNQGSFIINGRRRSSRRLKPVVRYTSNECNSNMKDDYALDDYNSSDSESIMSSEAEDDDDADYKPTMNNDSDTNDEDDVDFISNQTVSMIVEEPESEESSTDDDDEWTPTDMNV